MASTTASKRLRHDLQKLMGDPVPGIVALPLEDNILEWHYVVRGAVTTPYEGGYYHGKLIFPSEFPFKPPAIYMMTPSGRFETNVRLCLTISDYHPELWNPGWSVASILLGVQSFMNDSEMSIGTVSATDAERKKLAVESRQFNLNDPIFMDLFPELAAEIFEEIENDNQTRISTL